MNKYGQSLVSTTLVDSIERPSDGLRICLNWAAEVEFDWSAHQLSNQLYAGHWANDLTTSVPCDVPGNVWRANRCSIIKETSEHQSSSASVLSGYAISQNTCNGSLPFNLDPLPNTLVKVNEWTWKKIRIAQICSYFVLCNGGSQDIVIHIPS